MQRPLIHTINKRGDPDYQSDPHQSKPCIKYHSRRNFKVFETAVADVNRTFTHMTVTDYREHKTRQNQKSAKRSNHCSFLSPKPDRFYIPGKPPIPPPIIGNLGKRFFFPPPMPICFMTFCICSNCLKS